MVTRDDMVYQVAETLGTDGTDEAVNAVVDALQAKFGTVDVDTIDTEAYWNIVLGLDVLGD